MCTTLVAGSMVMSSLAFAHGSAGDKMMDMMDTNGDGMVSADEHAAGAKMMFDKMDANKDGSVTAAEMDAAHKDMDHKGMGHEGMSSADKIKMIDTDGDGKVSAAEHAAGSQMMFDKSDTNKDGKVDAAEMKAAHESMMGKKEMHKDAMDKGSMSDKPMEPMDKK